MHDVCLFCGGSGEVRSDWYRDGHVTIRPCKFCKGRGFVDLASQCATVDAELKRSADRLRALECHASLPCTAALKSAQPTDLAKLPTKPGN